MNPTSSSYFAFVTLVVVSSPIFLASAASDASVSSSSRLQTINLDELATEGVGSGRYYSGDVSISRIFSYGTSDCYPFGDCMDMSCDDALSNAYLYQVALDAAGMDMNASLTTIEKALAITPSEHYKLPPYKHLAVCVPLDEDVLREAGERYVRKMNQSYVLADIATYCLHSSRVLFSDVIYRTRDIRDKLTQSDAVQFAHGIEADKIQLSAEIAQILSANATERTAHLFPVVKRQHLTQQQLQQQAQSQQSQRRAVRSLWPTFGDNAIKCYRKYDCVERLNFRTDRFINATRLTFESFAGQTSDMFTVIEHHLNLSDEIVPIPIPLPDPVYTACSVPHSSSRIPDQYEVKVNASRANAAATQHMYRDAVPIFNSFVDRLKRIADVVAPK